VSRRRPTIEVALATFNSERFLSHLLDSLFGQVYQDFTILVADDASTDSTPSIVAHYAELHPGRIKCLAAASRRQGPVANFSALLDGLQADYALFCDHDDFWLPDKIAVCVEQMMAFEAAEGRATPLLLHTDMVVVGENLEVWAPSCMRYQGLDPRRNSLANLLMTNMVTGCASMFNRALYERARPIPPEAVMHDHWLAVVAAATGKILYLDKATLLYRQHGGNAIGARRRSIRMILSRTIDTLATDRSYRSRTRLCRMSRALLQRCGHEMTERDFRSATALADLWSCKPVLRFVHLWRHGLLLRGLPDNLGLFFVVATAPAIPFQQADRDASHTELPFKVRGRGRGAGSIADQPSGNT
jgi:hypothetical protein